MYSNKLYIGMTKSKSSASAIVVSSIFATHLINDAQFLNANWVPLSPATLISPLTIM